MAKHEHPPRIHLPRGWPRRVRSAMLHVIALGQYTVAYTRSWAVNGRIARVRLKAENDGLRQQVALLTEEIRIKDARLKRVDPQKRPHYLPTERMAILELRAARAWSVQSLRNFWFARTPAGPDRLAFFRNHPAPVSSGQPSVMIGCPSSGFGRPPGGRFCGLPCIGSPFTRLTRLQNAGCYRSARTTAQCTSLSPIRGRGLASARATLSGPH